MGRDFGRSGRAAWATAHATSPNTRAWRRGTSPASPAVSSTRLLGRCNSTTSNAHTFSTWLRSRTPRQCTDRALLTLHTGPMSANVQLGDFLRARRTEISPESVGLVQQGLPSG